MSSFSSSSFSSSSPSSSSPSYSSFSQPQQQAAPLHRSDSTLNYVFNARRRHTSAKDSVLKATEEAIQISHPSGVRASFSVKAKAATIPTQFTLPKLLSPYNQGSVGNCVANAFAYSIRHQITGLSLSRLQLYAICRILDNTPLSQDDGTTVKTACAALRKYGTCAETVYPFVEANALSLPPLTAFNSSKLLSPNFTYLFVESTMPAIKSAINLYKVPIVFVIAVYDSFLSNAVAISGQVPMPDESKEDLQGYHCVVLVGYNDAQQQALCVNSWGTAWGKRGTFMLPYAYVENDDLAFDFCVPHL